MKTARPRARPDVQATPAPRRVSILGATGSIGHSTVDVVKRQPKRYLVEAVTAQRNAAQLGQLARELGARCAVVADPAGYGELKESLAGTSIEAGAGRSALIEAAKRPADWVMAAITGAGGLEPTLAAIECGQVVALATKECLVCAGGLVMRTAAVAGSTILPVDSEHNAIFQALGGSRREDVLKITLTASGGPFRTWSHEAIRTATPEQALCHPNWSMGPKITIDSATLMNKGLEVIEAHHLFALKPNEIDVLVHPQSIVHGLVAYRDGSVIAALAPPDMRIPIAHCLAWPARIDWEAPRLDLARGATLTFELPDVERFPALALARHALEAGGGAPTVLNAANEVAVAEFLGRRLEFSGITALVEATLDAAGAHDLLREPASVEEAVEIDHVARSLAADILSKSAAKAF